MTGATKEHPKRILPPLGREMVDREGIRHPVMEAPVIKCGQRADLRGIGWVECVRRKGHPMSLVFAHSNGLGDEWCFDEAEAQQ